MGLKHIIDAVTNLDKCLKVPALQNASVTLNQNGKPYAFTGGFNIVFQLTCQHKKWAFRVWHVPMNGLKERYNLISLYLRQKQLPYFADFIYDAKGLLVNGEMIDIIRMEWLEQPLLKEYLERHLQSKDTLRQLATDFLEMSKTLEANGISHGDLQEGNIMIDAAGKIKLIDYDSLCIPAIEGQAGLVTGLKGYQHPSRFKLKIASLKADYFSALIIYLSILALSEKPHLWETYRLKESQYLLFTDTDFINFTNTPIFNDLSGLSVSIRQLLSVLGEYLKAGRYIDLLPFYTYLRPARIISFSAGNNKVLYGSDVTLRWETEDADFVVLNGTGIVAGSGSITLTAATITNHTLRTENVFGIHEETVGVEILPRPEITRFNVTPPVIADGATTLLMWEVNHAQKVMLDIGGIVEEVSLWGKEPSARPPVPNTGLLLLHWMKRPL